MVAVLLCAAFSGLTGLDLSLAVLDGDQSAAGVGVLAVGVVGLAGVVCPHLRRV